MVGSGQASEDAELAQVHGEACMQAVCGLDVSTVMWREHGLGVWWFPLGSVVCFECCQLSLPFCSGVSAPSFSCASCHLLLGSTTDSPSPCGAQPDGQSRSLPLTGPGRPEGCMPGTIQLYPTATPSAPPTPCYCQAHQPFHKLSRIKCSVTSARRKNLT